MLNPKCLAHKSPGEVDNFTEIQIYMHMIIYVHAHCISILVLIESKGIIQDETAL